MRTISIILALWFLPSVLIGEELLEFGFSTSSAGNSQTSATVTITAWFLNKVYRCTTNPSAKGTTYGCEARDAFMGCDTDNSEVKILISCPGTDAVIADSFFMTTNEATYTVTGFCIPDTASLGPYGPNYHQAATNLCSSGNTQYDALCVDNEQTENPYACYPMNQYVVFDISSSATQQTAEWRDGSSYEITAEECPSEECAVEATALSLFHECSCVTASECAGETGGYFCNPIAKVNSDLGGAAGAVSDPCTGDDLCCCHCTDFCADGN